MSLISQFKVWNDSSNSFDGWDHSLARSHLCIRRPLRTGIQIDPGHIRKGVWRLKSPIWSTHCLVSKRLHSRTLVYKDLRREDWIVEQTLLIHGSEFSKSGRFPFHLSIHSGNFPASHFSYAWTYGHVYMLRYFSNIAAASRAASFPNCVSMGLMIVPMSVRNIAHNVGTFTPASVQERWLQISLVYRGL